MEQIITNLRPLALLTVMAMLLVIVAMGMDLAYGWRKAKERGDAHSSYAFSRTITKFALYEGVLVIGGCMDLVVHFAWPMFAENNYAVPCVTFFLTIVLCVVEIWSMREKADQKTRNRINDAATLIAKTIGKEQLAKMIAEAVRKERDVEAGQEP